MIEILYVFCKKKIAKSNQLCKMDENCFAKSQTKMCEYTQNK